MEVCLGQYREKTSCSLWKRVGGSVLYAWGKAIYCQWGQGTDYYCAMGSTAYKSLGKKTRTARQVLAERILRTCHVSLDLPSVSNCPGPPASPQGSECTQSAKGAASSETLHVSDPTSPLTYTFPPSLISLVPSRLNTSMRHTVLIFLTATDILSLDLQAVLAVQLLETASFSLDESLWTLITLSNCECRSCKIPVWCAVTRYVNSSWFLRK